MLGKLLQRSGSCRIAVSTRLALRLSWAGYSAAIRSGHCNRTAVCADCAGG
jgi:hypothetical protein